MAWRILVTGATGCLGHEIVRRLHHREVEFVAACRQERTFPDDIKLLNIDFNEPALLEQAFRDVDVLFLLVPFSEGMVSMAANAIGAARRAGVQLIVRSSICGADANSAYLFLKSEGEINDLLLSSGVPSVIVQGQSFMQNFERHYASALQQGALFLPESEGRTAFLDAGDMACVIAEILVNPFTHVGKTYSITGGRALSNAEALAILSLQARKRISYVPITDEAARKAMMKNNASEWWIDFMMSRHRLVREGFASEVTTTFKDLMKREPRTFEDFCEEIGISYAPKSTTINLNLR